jgi:hypothetical protein
MAIALDPRISKSGAGFIPDSGSLKAIAIDGKIRNPIVIQQNKTIELSLRILSFGRFIINPLLKI